jgi:homoserine kinase type II
MLFFEDRVSSILDFDATSTAISGMTWEGRSFLYMQDNQINIEKTNAFIKGYSRHSALTLHDIADALRLCWCIEIPWWIQADILAALRKR